MTGDLARRLVLVRAATFGYAAVWLVVRGRYLWDVTALPGRRFEPVGLLALLDWRPGRAIAIAVVVATLCGAVLAAAGRMTRVTAPVAALGTLVVATLASSFGQVFHTEHLLVLHLLVLAGHAWIADRGRPSPDAWHVRWALGMLAAVTAITYVVAGVTKLRMAREGWVDGEVLRNWVAADNLRKLLLEDPYSAVGGRLAGVGWVWAPIAVATLAVELGAPLVALSARRGLAAEPVSTGWLAAAAVWAAPVWVATAWLFHVGVLGLMAIAFPYQLSGVAYLALLPVERIEGPVHSVLRRLRPYTRTTWRTHC